MTTISASSGQVLGSDGSPQTDPYSTFASNLTTLLQNAQKTANQGNANLQGQIGGLERGQVALGRPGANNPLNFLYNMAPASAVASEQSQMGDIFKPGITSIQGQEQLSNENLSNLQGTIKTATDTYSTMKPNWTLSPVPNADGEFYYYNTNTPAGQAPQTYAAGKIPPGVGGSPGGSPQSASSNQSLASSFNPYGIKMTATTTDLFKDLGATPGPAAVDGGNFWSFPDETTGEKAARALLTSSLYASDSVDQALRQWSNYTGMGKYPGYNSSILAGTGIDPNATIKSLSSVQIDAVLAAMKKAENVGGQANTTPTKSGYSPTSAPLDTSPVGTLAHNIAWGVNGLSYDAGIAQLNAMPGGSYLMSKLMKDIQTENPNFQVETSNQYAKNLATAQSIKPNLDAANQIIGTIDDKGIGSTGGLLNLYDQLAAVQKTNSGWLSGPLGFAVKGSGVGAKEQQAFNRAVTDVVSNVNNVLAAGGTGVAANNETISKLFPQDSNGNYTMDRQTLIQSIQQIQGFMNARYSSLTSNPFANSTGGSGTTGGTSGVTSSGLKYTVTQ